MDEFKIVEVKGSKIGLGEERARRQRQGRNATFKHCVPTKATLERLNKGTWVLSTEFLFVFPEVDHGHLEPSPSHNFHAEHTLFHVSIRPNFVATCLSCKNTFLFKFGVDHVRYWKRTERVACEHAIKPAEYLPRGTQDATEHPAGFKRPGKRCNIAFRKLDYGFA